MTDDQTQTSLDPTQSPAPQQDQQDPLAVLEGILQDARNKSGTATGASDPAAQAAQEQAQREAEAQAAAARQAEADRQAQLEAQRLKEIAEQQAMIQHELPKTSQFQARQQQAAEEIQEEAATSSAGEGYEIKQLDHMKVPVTDPTVITDESQAAAGE